MIYIDRKTGAEHRVKARIVVLAASALESVRILLNSGVANSSGKVGKYIMDTVGAGIGGQVPLLENMPLHNEDGADFGHMYSPWWLYKEQLAGKLGFARGYHFEFGGGRRMPDMGTASGLEWLNGGTYGTQVQGRRAALLRFLRVLLRPRRDDSERRLLRRARSDGEGQVRHSGAALPLEVVVARNRAGRAHAENCCRDHRGHGRQDFDATAEPARRPSSRAA